MPLYEYSCRECGASWEIIQSYNDEPIVDCVCCDYNNTAYRVMSIGYIGGCGGSTLGSLAEKNSKKLGGKKDEILQKMCNDRSGSVDKFKGKIPEGGKETHKPKDKPAPDMRLNKLTPDQKTKFILENKLPIGLK